MIIAATGHRPDKLGGYDIHTYLRLYHFAYDQLLQRLTLGDVVISGMALGWDMAIADAAMALGYEVIAAVPCDGQESRWRLLFQLRYQRLLKSCKEVVVVNPGPYAAWKMSARNIWMVDRAESIIALWNGSDGGTSNCVAYAEKRGKPVTNVWEQWLAVQTPTPST